MRIGSCFLSLFLSFSSLAQCVWSELYPVPNEAKLTFRECKYSMELEINGVLIKPSFDFDIIGPYYPEGNTLWDRVSAENKWALVWLETTDYRRQLWVIDLHQNNVDFTLLSLYEARHFSAKFIDEKTFSIVTGGMGYSNKTTYLRVEGSWIVMPN